MSATKAQIKVIFEGQTEPTVLRAKPVGLMAAERRWGGNAFTEHPIEAMLYAAFVSLGMPGGADGFEAWASSIADFVDDGDADPTSATSPGPSPPSQ